MNPKIQKLRAEREKHVSKIAELKERVSELDKQIKELENTDIIGLVRERGLTLEQFAALMSGTGTVPMRDTTEERDNGDTQT